MKKGLIILLMCIVPLKPNLQLIETLKEQKFIEENGLVRVKVSCYVAPENARTADGSLCKEGYCAGNSQTIGKDLILFDDDLVAVGRYQIRDVGGHELLQSGKAIDFYRDSLPRCYEFVENHGSYVWIKYVDRDEVFEME
ncbi:MAG: hypothetical protein J6X66_08855 [Lachnospiraceae bacterium]|nr:hypothetical protein [Lachnospiraceae bacterium]